MNSFDKGKVGEEAAIQWLSEDPFVDRIADVRDEIRWRVEDVDLLVFVAGERVKVEVKTDFNALETGNIFVGFLGIKETVVDDVPEYTYRYGWAFRSTADWFFIYLPQSEEFICVTKERLIALCFAALCSSNIVTSNAGNEVRIGALLPIDSIYEIKSPANGDMWLTF